MKLFLLVTLFLFSCTKSEESEAELIQKVEIGQVEKNTDDESSGTCVFSVDTQDRKLDITGYKFVSKTGVTGTFKDWTLNIKESGESLEDLLQTTSFEMVEKSLEFGKPARNTNIYKGLLQNISGDTISGTVQSVDGDARTLMVELSWGGSTNLVEMEYDYDESRLIVRGAIDILELGFTKAFGELGKICKVHHMKDGEAKTWSDVSILTSVKVVRSCS